MTGYECGGFRDGRPVPYVFFRGSGFGNLGRRIGRIYQQIPVCRADKQLRRGSGKTLLLPLAADVPQTQHTAAEQAGLPPRSAYPVSVPPHSRCAYSELKGDSDMNACNLTAAVTALANTIACELKAEEISLLSSLFMQLGDTLATIAAQRVLCQAREKE